MYWSEIVWAIEVEQFLDHNKKKKKKNHRHCDCTKQNWSAIKHFILYQQYEQLTTRNSMSLEDMARLNATDLGQLVVICDASTW